MATMVIEILPPPHIPGAEFDSVADVHRYTHQMSNRLTSIALDLELAAATLRKTMGQLPGMGAKSRARAVATHLDRAADCCHRSATSMNATFFLLRRAIDKARSSGKALPRRWWV